MQKQHRLGNGRAAVCAFFSVQYFALLPHTPLEAQLRHNPPSQLVLVNGTAVERKGRQRQGLVVVLRNAFNPKQAAAPPRFGLRLGLRLSLRLSLRLAQPLGREKATAEVAAPWCKSSSALSEITVRAVGGACRYRGDSDWDTQKRAGRAFSSRAPQTRYRVSETTVR